MMSTMTGKLIRDQRQKLGLLQKKVAKEVGITAVFWAELKTATVSCHRSEVEKIARVLELPIEQISFALQHDMAESLKKKIKK